MKKREKVSEGLRPDKVVKEDSDKSDKSTPEVKMTTVSVIRSFLDKKEGKNRFVGQSFTCDTERAELMKAKGFVE